MMSSPLRTLWSRITTNQQKDGRRDGAAPRLDGSSSQKRRSTRVVARVPLKVIVLGTEFKMDDVHYQAKLVGHTYNMSEIGLGIMLPQEHVADLDLSSRFRRIKIILELPDRPVEIYATAVHCRAASLKPARAGGAKADCLVGARITKITPEDGRLLRAYLMAPI